MLVLLSSHPKYWIITMASSPLSFFV
ncbi:rCG22892 [Rattus norvegicus]|uniref:RCG22892 n=1 Tax=Rattus norvegicus TaxID=10116 RepID=A6KP50_RAT|nr:rCG22892 [Rattus norvegicus]